jgi:rhodanese-related sulfurtransferase
MALMAARIAVLLAAALVLGGAANALSPRGLSWREPLGQDLTSHVSAAGFTPIGPGEMQLVFTTGSASIVDARPAEEFRTGRIKGAVSLPWRDVDAGKSGALPPRGKPVVVYCANEFCRDSLRLAQWLDGHGFKDIAVFVDGYDAWWNGGKGVVDQD